MGKQAEMDRMEKSLTNQVIPPEKALVAQRIERLRADAIGLSVAIISIVPEGRERSLALTKLEEMLMWAVKGCVLNQDDVS